MLSGYFAARGARYDLNFEDQAPVSNRMLNQVVTTSEERNCFSRKGAKPPRKRGSALRLCAFAREIFFQYLRRQTPLQLKRPEKSRLATTSPRSQPEKATGLKKQQGERCPSSPVVE